MPNRWLVKESTDRFAQRSHEFGDGSEITVFPVLYRKSNAPVERLDSGLMFLRNIGKHYEAQSRLPQLLKLPISRLRCKKQASWFVSWYSFRRILREHRIATER